MIVISMPIFDYLVAFYVEAAAPPHLWMMCMLVREELSYPTLGVDINNISISRVEGFRVKASIGIQTLF